MKKAISVLLAIAIVVALLPAGLLTVFADQSGDYTYTVSAGKATITRYNPQYGYGDIIIPAELGGYPVTAIGDGIWPGVNEPPNKAFMNCTGLTSITIPDTVTEIRDYAFNNCTGLTSLVLPAGLISIGWKAFSHCTSLTSISIPDSVTSIGPLAFIFCTGLTSVDIGSGVTSIGDQAFSRCFALTQFNVAEANTAYSSVNGVLFNEAQTILLKYPDGNPATSYIIPDGVTKIGCTGNNANSENFGAFRDAVSLTSVTIPDTVQFIGGYTFENCTGLTSLTIPRDLTDLNSVGNSAFPQTAAFAEFAISPNGNTKFSAVDGVLYSTFINTSNYANSTVTIWKYPAGKTGASYTMPSTIPGPSGPIKVKTIGQAAFKNCTALTSVTLSANLTSMMGASAFENCTGLTAINIPTAVTTIDASAFKYCTALTAISINGSVNGSNTNFACVDGVLFNKAKTTLNCYPSGKTGAYTTMPSTVTSIGTFAFQMCVGLTAVTIPAAVTSVSSEAFKQCSLLTAINVDEANTSYSSIDGVLFNEAQTSLVRYPEGKTGAYIIPNGVTTITDNAFYNCTGLTSVTIPDSVTSLGTYSFQNCSGLTAATIPAGVTSIGSYTFLACSNLKDVYFLGNAPAVRYNEITQKSYWSQTFNDNADGRLLHYLDGKTGFSNPWYGYTTTVPATFTVSSATGKTGSNVTVAISISADSNTATGTIVLPYDNTKLEFVSAVAGSAFGSSDYVDVYHQANTNTNLVYINTDGFNGAGSILEVTYKILETQDGVIPVIPNVTELCDSSWNNMSYTVLNGEIIVDNTGPLPATFDAAPTTPTNGNVTVTITYPVDAALQHFKVDDGAWIAYTVPVVLETNGTVYAKSWDALGNESTVSSIAITNIDKTPPEEAAFTPSTTDPASSLTVTITYPSDAFSKQYSYNGTDWFTYGDPVPLAVVSSITLLPVNRRVYARCFDEAGNMSPVDNYVDLPNLVMLGDVNLDDVVSVVDALMALQAASGKISLIPGTNAFFADDVNKSGTATGFDALRILQFASGKILSF